MATESQPTNTVMDLHKAISLINENIARLQTAKDRISTVRQFWVSICPFDDNTDPVVVSFWPDDLKEAVLTAIETKLADLRNLLVYRRNQLAVMQSDLPEMPT